MVKMKFKIWMENQVADEFNKGFDAVRGGAQYMFFIRAATLYAQGRTEEAMSTVSKKLLPDQMSKLMGLFKKTFPTPIFQSTADVRKHPEFFQWVEKELYPLVDSFNQSQQGQPQQPVAANPQGQPQQPVAPQQFSITQYLQSIGRNITEYEVTKSQKGNGLFVRNKRSGQVVTVDPSSGVDAIKKQLATI